MKRKFIIAAIITLSMMNPLFSTEVESLWGITETELIKRLKLKNYTIFKPEEKPQYNNRIIDFFNSMDSDQKARINIIRIDGNPEIDYCFFNEKLYSISEEWGTVDKNKALNLVKALKYSYTDTTSEQKKSNTVYSFKKNKTKVLLVKKTVDENSVQMRIFYYSVNIFSMLLCE